MTIQNKIQEVVKGIVGAGQVAVPDESNIIFDKDMNLTPIGINTILGQISVTFKSVMFSQDKNGIYSYTGPIKEVADPKFVKEFEAQFKEARKKYQAKLAEFQKQHPEMYATILVAPNIAKYCSVDLNKSFADITFDVDVANYLFRASSAEAKDFVAANETAIKVGTRSIIIPEFKDQLEEFKALAEKEVGLPTAAEIKEEIAAKAPLVKVQSQLLKRGKTADIKALEKEALVDEAVEKYVGDLFEHLIAGNSVTEY